MPDIILVAMPWDVLESPSLALGILQRLLRDAGLDVTTRSLKLHWMEYLLRHQQGGAHPIRLADYGDIACEGGAIGDWIFAEPPMASAERLAVYEGLFGPDDGTGLLSRRREMRRLAPGFLDACAEELLSQDATVIGFTTTFSQNMASLGLARRLKLARPSLRIVFGGGNCEGPMGAALQRSFPWIDVVVRGEAENIVVDVFRALLDGRRPEPVPGLCLMEGDQQVVVPHDGARMTSMDAVPVPDYDDYFAELDRTSFGSTLRATVFLPYESARGCWWGEVAHCTFCGLNGGTMAFRRKSPDRVFEEILGLARRHRVLDLRAVDNILDHSYFTTLLPRLARAPLDLRLFYEVKANLKKRQVALLRRAGVRHIQPGIESLSTPILKLMKKGVTAWQNLRLLKWGAQMGVRVQWNLVYGIPGEPESEYQAMTALMPSLWHLEVPLLSPLHVHRFSPYHAQPEEHGIEITGPAWFYQLLYDIDLGSLADIAYDFEFTRRDGRSPDVYTSEWLAAIKLWEQRHQAGAALVHRRGPGFVRIRDTRGGPASASTVDFVLEGIEADVYLACDDGARLGDIVARTGQSTATVQRILDELVAERLAYREGDHYLGLAIPAHDPAQAAAEAEDVDEDDALAAIDELLPLARLAPTARALSPR